MNKTRLILILTLSITVNCSAQLKNSDDYNFEIDSNVKKKITTMVYEAISSGDNPQKGKVVPFHLVGLKMFQSYSQIYYDEYDNMLYEEYYKENETIPWRTIKTIWFDRNKNKMKFKYEKTFWSNPNVGYFKKTIYERDENGNLTQILEEKDEKHELSTLETYKYDSQGNIIETIEYDYQGNIKNKSVYLHFDNNHKPMVLLDFDSSDQLTAEWKFEYYPNGLIKSENIARYKYGQLTSDTEMKLSYDNNNNLLTKRYVSRDMGWISAPNDLNGEEREKYIKEKYFGENRKLKETDVFFINYYDIFNNEVNSCTYDNNESPDSLSYFFRDPPCRKTSYKYNPEGDWIEMVKYNGENPIAVITREIEYFK